MKLLTYSNSCCNPFIYGFFNIDFRNALTATICKCKRYLSAWSISTGSSTIEQKGRLPFIEINYNGKLRNRFRNMMVRARVVNIGAYDFLHRFKCCDAQTDVVVISDKQHLEKTNIRYILETCRESEL